MRYAGHRGRNLSLSPEKNINSGSLPPEKRRRISPSKKYEKSLNEQKTTSKKASKYVAKDSEPKTVCKPSTKVKLNSFVPAENTTICAGDSMKETTTIISPVLADAKDLSVFETKSSYDKRKSKPSGDESLSHQYEVLSSGIHNYRRSNRFTRTLSKSESDINILENAEKVKDLNPVMKCDDTQVEKNAPIKLLIKRGSSVVKNSGIKVRGSNAKEIKGSKVDKLKDSNFVKIKAPKKVNFDSELPNNNEILNCSIVNKTNIDDFGPKEDNLSQSLSATDSGMLSENITQSACSSPSRSSALSLTTTLANALQAKTSRTASLTNTLDEGFSALMCSTGFSQNNIRDKDSSLLAGSIVSSFEIMASANTHDKMSPSRPLILPNMSDGGASAIMQLTNMQDEDSSKRTTLADDSSSKITTLTIEGDKFSSMTTPQTKTLVTHSSTIMISSTANVWEDSSAIVGMFSSPVIVPTSVVSLQNVHPTTGPFSRLSKSPTTVPAPNSLPSTIFQCENADLNASNIDLNTNYTENADLNISNAENSDLNTNIPDLNISNAENDDLKYAQAVINGINSNCAIASVDILLENSPQRLSDSPARLSNLPERSSVFPERFSSIRSLGNNKLLIPICAAESLVEMTAVSSTSVNFATPNELVEVVPSAVNILSSTPAEMSLSDANIESSKECTNVLPVIANIESLGEWNEVSPSTSLNLESSEQCTEALSTNENLESSEEYTNILPVIANIESVREWTELSSLPNLNPESSNELIEINVNTESSKECVAVFSTNVCTESSEKCTDVLLPDVNMSSQECAEVSSTNANVGSSKECANILPIITNVESIKEWGDVSPSTNLNPDSSKEWSKIPVLITNIDKVMDNSLQIPTCQVFVEQTIPRTIIDSAHQTSDYCNVVSKDNFMSNVVIVNENGSLEYDTVGVNKSDKVISEISVSNSDGTIKHTDDDQIVANCPSGSILSPSVIPNPAYILEESNLVQNINETRNSSLLLNPSECEDIPREIAVNILDIPAPKINDLLNTAPSKKFFQYSQSTETDGDTDSFGQPAGLDCNNMFSKLDYATNTSQLCTGSSVRSQINPTTAFSGNHFIQLPLVSAMKSYAQNNSCDLSDASQVMKSSAIESAITTVSNANSIFSFQELSNTTMISSSYQNSQYAMTSLPSSITATPSKQSCDNLIKQDINISSSTSLEKIGNNSSFSSTARNSSLLSSTTGNSSLLSSTIGNSSLLSSTAENSSLLSSTTLSSFLHFSTTGNSSLFSSVASCSTLSPAELYTFSSPPNMTVESDVCEDSTSSSSFDHLFSVARNLKLALSRYIQNSEMYESTPTTNSSNMSNSTTSNSSSVVTRSSILNKNKSVYSSSISNPTSSNSSSVITSCLLSNKNKSVSNSTTNSNLSTFSSPPHANRLTLLPPANARSNSTLPIHQDISELSNCPSNDRPNSPHCLSNYRPGSPQYWSKDNPGISGQIITLPPSIITHLDVTKDLRLIMNDHTIIIPFHKVQYSTNGVRVMLPPESVPEDLQCDSSILQTSSTSAVCHAKKLYAVPTCMTRVFQQLSLVDLLR